MKVAIRFIYYKAVTPSMYITELKGEDWSSFLYGDNDERREIACRVLNMESIRSAIREVSWIPLEGQDLLIESKHSDVKIPVTREKRKLYFDMDGTLVDFKSAAVKLTEEEQKAHPGHPEDVPGIFSLMDPMPGAIEAVRKLSKYYDCHILSTAPWDNPSAWTDKVEWIQKYLGEEFYKKVTLTHHKELLSDGESLLIDDGTSHGADAFGNNLIKFDSENLDWKAVTELLISKAERKSSGTWTQNAEKILIENGITPNLVVKKGSCIMPAPKHRQFEKKNH